MKSNAFKTLQRALALACIMALVIGVLPVYRASADTYLTVNLHEELRKGTIAYPNDTIFVVCDEPDTNSYYILYFVDENGSTLDYRYCFYQEDCDPVPDIKGIYYWELTDVTRQIWDADTDGNGKESKIYFSQAYFTAGYDSQNNTSRNDIVGSTYDNDNNNTVSGNDNGNNATSGNDNNSNNYIYGNDNNDNGSTRGDYYSDNNLPSNDQFFGYWDDVIANNAAIDFGQYQVTDQLEKTNGEALDRKTGGPSEQVVYEIAEADSDITATPTPTPEDKPRGHANPDDDYNPLPSPEPSPEPTEAPRGPANPDDDKNPSPSPEPTDDPRGHANPDVTDIPTATPEPTATPAPSATPVPSATPTPTTKPTATPTPKPTATPTPTPKPTATPVPQQVTTPMPTPYVPQTYVPPVPTGPVQVIAQVKEPEHSVYNIDVEVGRYANITPKYANESTFTVSTSNKSIILEPRSQVGSFSSTDYESRAMKPGNATLSFKSKSKNYTEDWNVNVFCRPLDFEKTQYVVYSPKDKDQWITLYLKYFEYEYEYAYDFVWTSSEDSKAQSKRQIYLAGGTKTTTYARYCIRKGTEGAFKVTVSDKYGNSASTIIIVRPEVVEKPSTGKTDTDTGKDSGNNSGKDTESTTLTAKQIKKKLKTAVTTVDCTVTSDGKYKFTWNPDDIGVKYDGHVIKYAEYKKGTPVADLKYKTLKTVKKGKTTKYTYSGSKLKKGKTYYIYVKSYVIINDKKYYTTVQSEDYLKLKIKK